MRLIDADALMKIVQHEEIQAQVHGREFSTCFMSPGGTMSTEWWYVENLIEDAPTIEERKTGKWKRTYLDHEAMGERPSIFYCSVCNQCIAFPVNYCPNCGADMRGDEE